MVRTRRRRSKLLTSDENISKQQRLWMLRCLVLLGGHKKFIEKKQLADDGVANAVGLGAYVDIDKSDFCRKRIIKTLKQSLAQLESEKVTGSRDVRVLEKNIARLSSLTPMTQVDQLALSFLAQLQITEVLDSCFDLFEFNTLNQVIRSLAVILDVPKSLLSSSISSTGKLIRCGIISYYPNSHSLKNKFQIISDRFLDSLYEPNVSLEVLLAELFSISAPSTLSRSDYEHLEQQIDLVERYLTKAKSSLGINVLIYGRPGTGKTELVRLISQRLKKTLYQVADTDENGEEMSARRRIQSYRSCQSFLKPDNTFVLFDEIEDIFNDGGFFSPSTASMHKSWMNQSLENNPVPTFWLSNSTAGMDAAFLRRFDIVFEATIPSRRQRKEICKQAFGTRLTNELAESLAENSNVTPAIIQRVAKVAKATSGRKRFNEADIRLMVDNVLTNQGHKPLKKHTYSTSRFNPKYTPSNANWHLIIQGLRETGEGRLCFYGPPGTGKTVASHYLAEQLDKPLHSHKVSDLMSKWVGGTEEQIAEAFEHAHADNAVLLLDEVDSFLRDRTTMSHSWEMTMVNEMLTQMEHYSGIFIASTNLMNTLDKAALRRFDIKVEFHYLSIKQRVNIFKQYCSELGLSYSSPLIKQLTSMMTLTPGDFAAVARRHRFNPLKTGDELVQCLNDECKLKPPAVSPIGFVR